jgi:hypothetical protein
MVVSGYYPCVVSLHDGPQLPLAIDCCCWHLGIPVSLNTHQLKLVGESYGLKVRIRVQDPSARALRVDAPYRHGSQHV